MVHRPQTKNLKLVELLEGSVSVERIKILKTRVVLISLQELVLRRQQRPIKILNLLLEVLLQVEDSVSELQLHRSRLKIRPLLLLKMQLLLSLQMQALLNLLKTQMFLLLQHLLQTS